MRGHNFLYFLKEGVKGIFVHGFMSFAAVSVIVACLIITGTFSLLVLNVNVLIDRAQEANEILAFVDETLSDTEALALVNKIYQVENVESAEFVTRDEALADYYSQLGEDAESLLVGISGEDLRHRYRVKLVDLELTDETAEAIDNISGIGSVSYSVELGDATLSMQSVIRVVSFVLAAILFFVSMFMIANTVKLATSDRREEIGIMKIVGATNSFIRWPFVVQGSLLGIFGGAVAYFAQWGIYDYACKLVVERAGIGILAEDLISFSSIAMPMLVIFLAAGFLVGVFGGVLTIRKFMRV